MKTRTIIVALLILSICILKFMLPEKALEIRQYITPTIKSDAFRNDIIALGRAISGRENYVYVWERFMERINRNDRQDPEPQVSATLNMMTNANESFVLDDMIRQRLSGYEALVGLPKFAPSVDTKNEPDSTPVESLSEPLPETISKPAEEQSVSEQALKVEAFMKQQAAFSDYSVPANVSYDIPELPFDYASPVISIISSGFGFRKHPIDGDVSFHFGTDFGVVDGSDINAFADGNVITVQNFDGYGLTVIIDHGNNYSTLYAHCSQILVKQGDKVKRGDKIALSGRSGRVTGPHLHFELIHNGIYLNPEFYC